MIAPVQQPQERARAESWQRGYLRLLPDIQRRAALTFRQLPPEARAEAVQEVTVHTMLAYRRLAQRGRTADAYPSVLTRYAVAHYRVGRRTASAMNCRDVMSPSARCRKHITVERRDPRYARDQVWQEILVEDKTAGPAEIAEYRIDVAEWLATLPRRQRRIAQMLATGETTRLAARRLGLSPARVSQVRRELYASWQQLQGGAR